MGEEVEAEPVKEEPPAAVPVTAPTSYKHTWTAKPLGIGLAKTNTASPSLRVSKVKRADLSSVITVGDTLLSVDGVDATGWSLQDAFAVMKAWSGATPLVIEFGSQKLKAEEVKVAALAVEPVAEKAEVKVVSAEKKAEADVVQAAVVKPAAVPVEKQTKVVKPEVVQPVAEPVAKKVEEAVQLSVLDMAKAAVRAAKAAHQHFQASWHFACQCCWRHRRQESQAPWLSHWCRTHTHECQRQGCGGAQVGVSRCVRRAQGERHAHRHDLRPVTRQLRARVGPVSSVFGCVHVGVHIYL